MQYFIAPAFALDLMACLPSRHGMEAIKALDPRRKQSIAAMKTKISFPTLTNEWCIFFCRPKTNLSQSWNFLERTYLVEKHFLINGGSYWICWLNKTWGRPKCLFFKLMFKLFLYCRMSSWPSPFFISQKRFYGCIYKFDSKISIVFFC